MGFRNKVSVMKKQANTEPIVIAACALLISLCLLGALQPLVLYLIPLSAIGINAYLWLHASRFTNLHQGSRKLDTYRALLILSIFLVTMFLVLSLLQVVLPEQKAVFQDMRYLLIVFFLLLFSNQAPRIPYNRTLGLRISWTLDDEATWVYAHRMMGYCGIPCALGMLVMYMAGYQQAGFIFFLIFLLVPSLLSYRFYRKQGWVLTETSAAYKSIWIIPMLHLIIVGMLYSYLPNDFPMQFSGNGVVNYSWPKPYALATMIGVELLLIFYLQNASAKRLWTIVTMLFLAFMATTFYILFHFS